MRPFVAMLHAWLSGSRIRNCGSGNHIDVSDSIRRKCRIRVSGNDNSIHFGRGRRLWDFELELIENHYRLRLGAGCQVRGGRWVLEDQHSSICVGAKTTFFEGALIASEGMGIRIGEDCMFSSDVEIRSSDGHSILDSTSGKRLNPAARVNIGDHVWIGAGARVMKGALIGSQSVVAAGAVVTGQVPGHVIVAGTPARVLREQVIWDRRRILNLAHDNASHAKAPTKSA